jgi:cellulose synthase/poly-beta-1,6-N-acetylglucosamine synthase-like glycosyltransferase
MIWSLLHIVDILLWVLMAGSAGYVIFFGIASLVKGKEDSEISEKSENSENSELSNHSSFLIIYPAYREDAVIRQSVATFLQQDYPTDRYRLVVVSDHMQAETNEWLAQQQLTLLQPTFEKSSKAKALQFAIDYVESHLQRSSTFTHVVILDADNVVASDFLHRLNEVCAQGYSAIQCHRTAKNANNDIAALDGISEEINNTLFRRAHNAIGLSSALIGSGMCFDYPWFRENVHQLTSAVEDRELEALLMKQNVFVKYESSIHVMDEKVSNQDNFQRQRLRWMTGQLQTLFLMLPYLPTAIRHGNVNYIDKTIQQMLIPRSILLVLTALLSVLITIVAPTWSIKWWCLLGALCAALLIAIPRALRTKALFGKLASLLLLVWRMLKNLIHIDRSNKEFIHTAHDK